MDHFSLDKKRGIGGDALTFNRLAGDQLRLVVVIGGRLPRVWLDRKPGVLQVTAVQHGRPYTAVRTRQVQHAPNGPTPAFER